MLVGSTRERRGFDTSVDPGVSAALLDRAARLFGGLRSLRVAGAWAGLRPWLPDHLPAIGPSARSPASGSRPATRAPASASARSPASCSRSSTPASRRSSTRAPFTPDRFGDKML